MADFSDSGRLLAAEIIMAPFIFGCYFFFLFVTPKIKTYRRPLFSLALVFLAGTFLLGQKWSAGKINAAAKIIGRQKVKDADRKEKEKINSRP